MPRPLLTLGMALVALATTMAGLRPATTSARPTTPPTFTVNSPADVVASAPLDNGICQTAPTNQVCTLRAAIMKANHWPGGGATISLPALPPGGQYTLSIPRAPPTMKPMGTCISRPTSHCSGPGPPRPLSTATAR